MSEDGKKVRAAITMARGMAIPGWADAAIVALDRMETEHGRLQSAVSELDGERTLVRVNTIEPLRAENERLRGLVAAAAKRWTEHAEDADEWEFIAKLTADAKTEAWRVGMSPLMQYLTAMSPDEVREFCARFVGITGEEGTEMARQFRVNAQLRADLADARDVIARLKGDVEQRRVQLETQVRMDFEAIRQWESAMHDAVNVLRVATAPNPGVRQRINDTIAKFDSRRGAKLAAEKPEAPATECACRKALEKIVGTGPHCAGKGVTQDDDGVPFSAEQQRRMDVWHRSACKRCIAQDALATPCECAGLREQLESAKRSRAIADTHFTDSLEEMAKLVAKLRAELAAANERAERAEAASLARLKDGVRVMRERDAARQDLASAVGIFRWLLGEDGEFPARKIGEGAYYWRNALRERSAATVARFDAQGGKNA